MHPFASFNKTWPRHRVIGLRHALGTLVLALWLDPSHALAQSPPSTPPITSPVAGQVISPFDAHMEAGPFSDSDPGDTHSCTDWEIWTVSPLQRVWVTSCIAGVELVHTHLADGVFENTHAGRTSLFYSTGYKLRVQFLDNTGLWSGWAEELFSTGAQTQVFPLFTNDVASGATWRDETEVSIILPPGSTPPRLRVESGLGGLLLELGGNDGVTNSVLNPSPLPADVAIRVTVDGGSPGLPLPQSRIAFTDPLNIFHTIYLPAVSIPPSGQAFYWVSSDGGTYLGTQSQTDPDFSTLARGSPVPWTVFQPGFEVEIVATGFQLPVNIAFVPNPGPNLADPYYYVTELYGTIKVVTRGGAISDYATDLLNFDPTGLFPGSGEQGLAGIVVDAVSGDLFAGMLYDAAPPTGPHYPKVVRFHSTDGGMTAATQTTILSMPGETQGQSHFISNFTFGPDQALYVHMGDGFTASTALDLDSFRGKILRMNLDGSAPPDNPFYDAGNGINARDYVYAYGFRNPFGGAWRAADGKHYEVENGSSANDRFARVLPGVSYGWNGNDASMTAHAIYNWTPTVGPVNIAFIEPETFGGSYFPTGKHDHAFVTLSGSTYASGPSAEKAIVEFVVDASGGLVTGPTPLIQYSGSGKATAVGLAAGPDGLYFTDLYKDQGALSPIDPGANVLRLKYRGYADFSASVLGGIAPLTTVFTDLSDLPSITSWYWEFGDGSTSTSQNPIHTYVGNGIFDVRLSVTGANGAVIAEKGGYIVVGPFASGLLGKYYLGQDLLDLELSRIDLTLDFDWGGGSPAAVLPANDFSVRWTGEVQPEFSETYRLFTSTDDGVRLWVDNVLWIDHWVDQGVTEWWADVPLTAGNWYPIKMEYYENGGDAVARLSWQSASRTKQVIPEERLRTGNPLLTAVEPTLAPGITRATLFPAAPNPFRSDTRVAFAVPKTGHATLRLYDVRGALVATLFDAVAGGLRRYEIPLHARNLAAGIYFQVLEAAGTRLARKLVVLR